MLKLDNTLLDELGLGGLPEDQKRAMLQHIYETLELRVGTNLANQMTDQQLEEFEKFIDDGGDANQAQALQWLETNLPNYKQVVNEVFEALKTEVKTMAPQLMAASAAQPVQMTQPAAPAGVPQPVGPTPQPMDTGMPLTPAPGPAAAPQQSYYASQTPIDPYTQPAAPNGYDQQAMPAASYAPPMPQAPVAGPADFGAQPMASPAVVPTPPPADPSMPGAQQVVPPPVPQPPMPAMPQQPPVPGPQGVPAPVPPADPYSSPAAAPQQLGQDGYMFPAQQPPAGPGGYPTGPMQ